MDETFLTNAIVLQRDPFRENDSRVIAYSLEHGKLELIARGTKKILSKLAGHIEPASLSEIMVIKGRQYDYAGSAIAQENYIKLKSDLEKITAVGIAFKAFNKIVKPGVVDARLFYLLLEFLNFLNKHNTKKLLNYELFAYYFIFKLLSELGFRPALHNCVVCNKKLEPKTNFFSVSEGGVVCRECREKEPGSRLTISENAIKILRLINERSFIDLAKIRTDKRLEKELMSTINNFYQYHF